MKRKPIILMTTSNINSQTLGSLMGDTEVVYSDRVTADIIVKAGGLPLYLPSIDSISENELRTYLDLADGLLITGANSNVNPIYYGESPLQVGNKTRVDDERDQVDIVLIRLAYKKKMPLLGICKGMQVINVALGGTLYQDVNTQHPQSSNHDVAKTNRSNLTHLAVVEKGSIAEEVFGKGEIMVNGGHQQAVKDLAADLLPSATAKDGVVEIYEGKSYPFLVGTQFHPELRAFDPSFFHLFECFVSACSKD